MEIVKHELCTHSIGAPADMPEGCDALPVCEVLNEHGKWSVSFWKPTHEEMQQLLANGSIAMWVGATGRQQPVVGLAVQP